MLRLVGDHLCGKLLFTWLSLVMSLLVSSCAVFFPPDVLDVICDLIESVSEGFITYSLVFTLCIFLSSGKIYRIC